MDELKEKLARHLLGWGQEAYFIRTQIQAENILDFLSKEGYVVVKKSTITSPDICDIISE